MKINLYKSIHNSAAKLKELFVRSPVMTVALVLLVVIAIGLAVYLFFSSATPNTITITAGPEDSLFFKNAEKYRRIMAKQGIKLKILQSEGSFDNLKKLTDPKINVDVGFVQGGEAEGFDIDNLVSLGSVAYQPIMIFYRGEIKKELSEFKGQRLVLGKRGSGAHALALTLLKANGVEPGDETPVLNIASADLVQAFIENRIDAVFATGDSASPDIFRQLMKTPGIRLFNFLQADAYTRHVSYLSKIVLPRGSIDLGKNIPEEDVILVGPTTELLARQDMNSALIDVLLEAVDEVHSPATLYRKRGEFPVLLENEYRISPEAARYYSTGKSFLYRNFPFWLACLITRSIAAIVPIILLLIPGIKLIPVLWRWHWRSSIFRWYKALFSLEREAFSPSIDAKKQEELLCRLDHIENTVNKISVPALFGDQLYALRGHISFVRERLLSKKK